MEVAMAKQMRIKHLLETAIFSSLLISVCIGAGPEQGIFTKTVAVEMGTRVLYEGFTKSMYNKTDVALTVHHGQKDCVNNPHASFSISWMIRYSECEGIYDMGNSSMDELATMFEFPASAIPGEMQVLYYRSQQPYEVMCENLGSTDLADETYDEWQHFAPTVAPTKPAKDDKETGKTAEPAKNKKDKERQKRDGEGGSGVAPKGKDPKEPTDVQKVPKEPPKNKNEKPNQPGNQDDTAKDPKSTAAKKDGQPATKEDNPITQSTAAKNTDKVTTTKAPPNKLKNRVTRTQIDGRYLFIVKIEPKDVEKKMDLEIKVEMKSGVGYLSAFQWPLLPFFGVMCAVYTILAFVWLLLLGCNWRDLLRIQFWICGVIVLGLLEKAIFYAEYEHVNKYGVSVSGAIIFAELMSCLKRSLARMLLIIVSLGYGITRPRLGRDLHWVMAAGSAYFILSSVEGCLRVKGNEKHALIAVLPLAVLDAVVCWWIFKNLVDTTRQLRLRRNLTKLWLYRHLTNTLIVCIICAVVFLVWSTKAHRWTACVTKWRELWLDDAYWHVLFCIILTVIMVLVRPTANNQRYAFSPLVDAADDEESQQPMINDAFDSVKMRQMPGEKTSSGKSAAEDALKWVEDNIPAAVADAALGAFDDSEEELVNTLERNKME